jgi:hypothetical protein
MSKELMTTAKELAWKAYCEGIVDGMGCKFENINSDIQSNLRIKFELWWSMNYGNSDTTKFYHEHNVYVDGSKYIKAE